ncbi:MAG TPA: hypothetical protein VFT23_10090 [Burkholderiales bacterium]|nr:hypothetical protein [Burkholderiales bacterium]
MAAAGDPSRGCHVFQPDPAAGGVPVSVQQEQIAMQNDSRVREAERQLRDIVNTSPVQDQLMGDLHRWRQLCSSMDAIGDTELAVEAYFDSPAGDGEYGKHYLEAYGLLQVLFVQQDALKHAAEAIGLPYSLPASLIAIREVRNNAVGHPTKRGRSQSESFGIVRASLSHEGFTLYSFDNGLPDNFQPVRLLELIEVQRDAVVDGIRQMISHLQILQ